MQRNKKGNNIPILRTYIDILFSYFIYGFYLEEYKIYDFYRLNSFGKKAFLNFKQHTKLCNTYNNKEKSQLFDKKDEFNTCFCDYIARAWLNTEKNGISAIEDFLFKHKNVIVKPLESYGGEGVYKINTENQEIKELSKKLSKESCIIEECICNHKGIRKINLECLNTMRIFTIVDDRGEVKIIKAFFRTGRKGSIIDNRSANGIVCPINLNTGIIDRPGITNTEKDILYSDAKEKLIGFEIPRWKETIETVKEYKNKTPIIPYVERAKIVNAIKFVDEVVPQENRDKMRAYYKYKFDVMFVGDDWKGNKLFQEVEKELNKYGSKVVYFPYTKGTSSTILTCVLNDALKK